MVWHYVDIWDVVAWPSLILERVRRDIRAQAEQIAFNTIKSAKGDDRGITRYRVVFVYNGSDNIISKLRIEISPNPITLEAKSVRRIYSDFPPRVSEEASIFDDPTWWRLAPDTTTRFYAELGQEHERRYQELLVFVDRAGKEWQIDMSSHKLRRFRGEGGGSGWGDLSNYPAS